MSDLVSAVQHLAAEVAEVRSHVPRIGALEHREILMAASITRLAKSVDELNDLLFKFANTSRLADEGITKRLDELLARKP